MNIYGILKTAIGIVIIIVLIRQVEVLPWWSFVVPVFLFGAFICLKRWQVPAFLTGLATGFLLWTTVSAYYDAASGGAILQKFALLFLIPRSLILIISGLIGGLLTGLALYAGKNLFTITK